MTRKRVRTIDQQIEDAAAIKDPRFMMPEEQQAHIAAAKRVLDGFKELEPIFEKHQKLLELKRQGKNYKL